VHRYSEALFGLLKKPEMLRQMSQAARDRISANFQLQEMGEKMEGLIVESQKLHSQKSHLPLEMSVLEVYTSRGVANEYNWLLVEQGKAWLEEQWKNWMGIAEERAKQLEELKEDLSSTKQILEEKEKQLKVLEKQLQEQGEWAQGLEKQLNQVQRNLFKRLQAKLNEIIGKIGKHRQNG
jgi:hypothetical protein